MEYSIIRGIINEKKNQNIGLGSEDFGIIFRKLLTKYKVPHVDIQCGETDNVATVRFNRDTNKLEYLADPFEHIFVPYETQKQNYSVRYNPNTKRFEFFNPDSDKYSTIYDVSSLSSADEWIAEKLNTIEEGAEVNVQSDWEQNDTEHDSYIKNKPEHLVIDSQYVHTDNNYTNEDKEKLNNTLSNEDIASWAKQPNKPTYTKEEIGLGEVDNTSDLNKPISNATQIELDKKADIVDLGSAAQADVSDFATAQQGAKADTALQSLPEGTVIDENYVHTDNNYTDEDKQKVADALTSETDPTVPSWAKQPDKPAYTKAEIGLGNVDNTSDVDKPVSNAVQTELNKKADTTSLGTAAYQNSTDFATAAQGAKADTALQVETQTILNTPTLTGNILSLSYVGENGVVQTRTIDLSSLTTTDVKVSNATYNAATNTITITNSDSTSFDINLSEFSILTTTDENGVTTLTQEVVDKLVVSRVGQSGEYDHLLNKPVLGTASAANVTDFATAAQGVKADTALQLETDPTVPAHVKAITETDISNWNTPSHTHANKALLDSYTQSESNLSDAVLKRHEHANKTELDSITATKISQWDAALQPEDLTSIATQLGQKANTADLGTAAFTAVENYIQNQTTVDQPGDFRISGNGRVGGTFGIGGDPGGIALAVNKNISSTTIPPTGDWQLLTYSPLLTSSKSTYTQTGHVNGRFVFSTEDYTIQNDGLGSNVYGYGKLIKLTTQGSSGTTDLYGQRVLVYDNSEITQNTWLTGISSSVIRNTAPNSLITTGIIGYAVLSPTAPITMTGNSLTGITATASVEMQTTGYGIPATVNLTNLNGMSVSAVARIHPSDASRFANITNINGIIITAGAANSSNVVVQNTYGIRILNGYANSSATMTNHYGIYIDDTSMGDVKNYNIWSGGTGLNFLSGNTGIGVENPVEKLEVAGNVKADAFKLNSGLQISEFMGSYTFIGKLSGGMPVENEPFVAMSTGQIMMSDGGSGGFNMSGGSLNVSGGNLSVSANGVTGPDVIPTDPLHLVNKAYVDNNFINPSQASILFKQNGIPSYYFPVWFDRDAWYGTPDTALTGNIIDNLTNAKAGVTAVIFHSGTAEPTYPAHWKKLSGSSTYNTTKVNIIYAQYFDGTVLFTITHML